MITKAKTGLLATAIAVICALVSPAAVAEGNAEEGAALGYSCLGCHGIDGYRNAYPSYRVPKLGGQKASYLEIALRGYRDGTRKHPTMNGQAESLSDEQIENVAAYFATLNADTVEAGGSEGISLEQAATCTACHGQNGISLSPAWPTLAGQHEDYLVHALKAYRDGDRSDPQMMPMAANLTDPEIKLLAKYFSRLEGLETTKSD
ncbi:MAG: c-type cytochrome [Pseudomonadota bacterium]